MLLSRRAAILCGAALLIPDRASASWPPITVHKDPNCGCCGGWIAHLELHGFQVTTIETSKLNRVKAKLGVPFEVAACHTAEIDGYLIEGHVPAAAIKRFLKERPAARGLAVPGMPQGSPGMSGEFEEYDVILFGPNIRRVYARFKGEEEIKR